MIALLPLRGWVGDAMAAQMAMQQFTAAGMGQVHDSADPHADCHGKTAAASPASIPAGETEDASVADCGSCTSCQVCHTVAMAAAPDAGPVTQMAHAAPPLPGMRFASAEPARGFKPPIS